MSDGMPGFQSVDSRQHWDTTMSKGFGLWSPLEPSPNGPEEFQSSDIATPRPSTADGFRSVKRRHIANMLADSKPSPSFRGPAENSMPSPTSIGVALGSPSQSPWRSAGRSRPSLDSNIPSPMQGSVPKRPEVIDPSPLQRKRSIFNSIFSRKASTASQLSSPRAQHVQSPSTPATARQHFEPSRRIEEGNVTTITASPVIQTPRWNELSRKPSVGNLLRKSSKGLRPRPQKAATVPAEFMTGVVSPLDSAGPSPTGSSIISPKATSPIPRIPPESPFLDVAIPNIAMERYSVMFSDVLKSRKPLLARRQTQLRELRLSNDHIEESALDIITQSPEALPVRRATVPSPRSPRIPLQNPATTTTTPSTSQSTIQQQRAGLSRSNTLPSPNRQDSMTNAINHKSSKDATAYDVCSPVLGSEASMSLQSDGSINSSEISELSCDDSRSEEIIIQLEDLSLPNGLNIQHYPAPLFSTTTAPTTITNKIGKKQESPIQTLYQPNLPFDRPRVVKQEEIKYSPRTSSRAQFSSSNHQPPRVPMKSHTTALQQPLSQPQTETGPPTTIPRSNSQTTAATTTAAMQKPLPRFNPLQSSPASPVEITLARQLSLSRSRAALSPSHLSPLALSPLSSDPAEPLVLVAKTARQPHTTTIVNPNLIAISNSRSGLSPDAVLEPQDWRAPLPNHMRNKSEHVVFESV